MAGTQAMSLASAGASTASNSTLSGLHDRLDSLWMTYLRHLDAYTSAQKTLQQHMRSGFVSLSRANFNARPGMRYGKDYFHERAIATRRVIVSQDNADEGERRYRLANTHRTPDEAHGKDEDASEKAVTAKEDTQQPSPPVTPNTEDEKEYETTTKPESSQPSNNEKVPSNNEKTKPPLEADPLRWYGILIPRELRSAQASFSNAVDDSASSGVNAARAMREIEAEIRKLRKEIRKAERAEKV